MRSNDRIEVFKVEAKMLPAFIEELNTSNSSGCGPYALAGSATIKDMGDHFLIIVVADNYPFVRNQLKKLEMNR